MTFRHRAALVAVALLSLLTLIGCGEDTNPAAVIAVASPSPSPSPTPTPPPTGFGACDPVALLVSAYVDEDGQRTKPVRAWGLGQIALLHADLVNAALRPLDSSCNVPLLTAWEQPRGGAACRYQGNTNTPDVSLKCNTAGDVTICARMAGVAFGCADFRVVQGATAAVPAEPFEVRALAAVKAYGLR